jgi:hypothetical protein
MTQPTPLTPKEIQAMFDATDLAHALSGVQAAPEKLKLEGACRECTVRWPIKDGGPVVFLCPLHAQAEALREALHALLARYDKVGGPLAVGRAVDEARALLATIQKGISL